MKPKPPTQIIDARKLVHRAVLKNPVRLMLAKANDINDLVDLIDDRVIENRSKSEYPALEFKRLAGEMKEGRQTLRAFSNSNGSGGAALFAALGLFLTIAVCGCAPRNHEESFQFVVWGDSQLENTATFERIVGETELLKPALVLQTGDTIVGYTTEPRKIREQWARFRRQIAPLSAPYHPVAGNHDVTTTPSVPIFKEVWGLERTYYSFDHGESHFIMLDTNLSGAIHALPPEEREWLEADLERHKTARHIFLSFHSPLYMNENFDWKAVRDLLSRYPVRAVFTGDSHIYDYRVLDGVRYFCLNSSGTMPFSNHLAGYSHSYLVVSVRGAEVSYAAVADGHIYPPDAVAPDEFNRSRDFLESDQVLIIPNPQTGPVDASLDVPLHNRAKESRAFTLRWETDDFRWRLDPPGWRGTLAAGERRAAAFRVSGPQGVFRRKDLPRLRVESPYRNGAGYETTTSYAYRLFAPPETAARQLHGAIQLDGRLDEPAWRDMPAIQKFVLDYDDRPATDTTRVKILYDDRFLYVGVWGEEPNPAGLIAKASGPIPLVFGDDDFELYLDPKRDMRTFYRLAVNCKGTVLSSSPAGLFTFQFDVKTYVGENYWSAEFRIPYDQIKADPPKAGTVWGLNVRRYRQQSIPAQSEWSKMQTFPAQPPYFGLLRFEEMASSSGELPGR